MVFATCTSLGSCGWITCFCWCSVCAICGLGFVFLVYLFALWCCADLCVVVLSGTLVFFDLGGLVPALDLRGRVFSFVKFVLCSVGWDYVPVTVIAGLWVWFDDCGLTLLCCGWFDGCSGAALLCLVLGLWF